MAQAQPTKPSTRAAAVAFNPAPPVDPGKLFIRALKYLELQPFNRCDREELDMSGQVELLLSSGFVALVSSGRCELTDNGKAYLRMWRDAEAQSR